MQISEEEKKEREKKEINNTLQEIYYNVFDNCKDGNHKYEYKENFEEAYTSLKNKLQADDMLLVTGSFYLVGAVLNYCKRGKDES